MSPRVASPSPALKRPLATIWRHAGLSCTHGWNRKAFLLISHPLPTDDGWCPLRTVLTPTFQEPLLTAPTAETGCLAFWFGQTHQWTKSVAASSGKVGQKTTERNCRAQRNELRCLSWATSFRQWGSKIKFFLASSRRQFLLWNCLPGELVPFCCFLR